LESTKTGAVMDLLACQNVLLFSEAAMSELANVFFRQKLDRYVCRDERQHFLRQLASTAEFVPIVQIVRECRDPKGDKFLEVALTGRADVPREILEELKIGPYANKNSFVLSSLIVSLNFAAFSNSNRLAASRISLSSFTM
jgi:putative PIN family toxin of toxin-antitoxin system